jgi:hypothetical protein
MSIENDLANLAEDMNAAQMLIGTDGEKAKVMTAEAVVRFAKKHPKAKVKTDVELGRIVCRVEHGDDNHVLRARVFS